MYAAIVPTLQRSSLLPALLDALAAHDLVSEVLVVNNAERTLTHPSDRVRIVQPGGNIFVNPAWNLGVAETTAPRLAVVNDDVRLPPALLAAAAERLDRGAGIIGPHHTCFSATPRRASSTIRFRPAWWRGRGFGSLMLMDRSSWQPIPEDLRVYFGDDYLFRRQARPNYFFHGVHLASITGTTVSSAEFKGLFRSEEAIFRGYPEDPYGDRFRWRSAPARGARRVRRAAGVTLGAARAVSR